MNPAEPAGNSTPRPATRGPSVVAVTVLMVLQALGVLGVAVSFALELGQGVLNLGAQLFLIVLVLAAALWIGASGIGVWRGRAWTRAATVVIEVFAVILSVSFLSGGNPGGALVLFIPAAVVLVLMFSRPLARHLDDRVR